MQLILCRHKWPVIFMILLSVFGLALINKSDNPDLPQAEKGKWVAIFNGKNLDGWIPKVTGYKAGENPLEGFRVEDGILKVDYSKFLRFNGRFGHLFYKKKLSSYILRVEYRFIGEVLPDAPGYCYRNSGVMFWFKPDGSGREMTFEMNIAGKDGKNIHDLWSYAYKCEKGDTNARIVSIPFFNLVHNTKFADSPDVSPVFKPEAVIEVAI